MRVRDTAVQLFNGHQDMAAAILGQRTAATRALKAVYGDLGTSTGFGRHFSAWCDANGFKGAEFLKRVGFGGRGDHDEPCQRSPIILVCGNGCDASFMEPLIQNLLAQGYKRSEVYAITYNRADPHQAHLETHDPKYIKNVRQAFDAIAKYTGRAPRIVGHSMGSTVAQLAIQGVAVADDGTVSRFAPKLAVKTFVGAAGANQGLETCRDVMFPRVSNEANGFHPEAAIYRVLSKLPKAADRVYSIVALNDELLENELASANVKDQDGEIIMEPRAKAHLAPIWEPQALVKLLTRGAGLTSHDTFEQLPRKFETGGCSLADIGSDLQCALLNSASHLVRAAGSAALGEGPFPVGMRSVLAGATAIYAIREASRRSVIAPLDLFRAFLFDRNDPDAALKAN